MPTYEYICKHCGNAFEEFQSIKDEPLTKCPKCGKEPTRQISAGAGVIFKGTGFYQTDYRSGDYKSKQSQDVASSGASSTTKTETSTK